MTLYVLTCADVTCSADYGLMARGNMTAIASDLPVGLEQIKPEGFTRMYVTVTHREGTWYIICNWSTSVSKEIKGDHVDLQQLVD